MSTSTEGHTHQQTTADLPEVVRAMWRRRWLLLVPLVLLPLVAYLGSKAASPRYEGVAVVEVQPQAVDTSLFGAGGVAASQTPEQALAAAARFTETEEVAERAAARLDRPRSEAVELVKTVETSIDPDSAYLTITTQAGDRRNAARLANAFAVGLVDARAERAENQIDTAVREVEQELASLPVNDQEGRRQLSQQLQRLRALRAAQGYNAQVLDFASPPESPISPRPLRNAVLALLLALFLGSAAALLRDRLDQAIRNGGELEELTGAPLLVEVPATAFMPGQSDIQAAEAFRTLRASLTYFNVDRSLKSVLMTSPGKGDGKTTAVTNLAIAVARSGRDVFLVDTDLRDSRVALRLGIRSRPEGLATVLVGQTVPEDATIELEAGPGRLRVLPAGVPPPNPSELIASQSMRGLLSDLESQADLVLIDTAAALLVGDAIPLFDQVSGIVVVGRLGVTSRDSMTRLVSVIGHANGSLLGVVATGGPTRSQYGYAGYARTPTAGPHGDVLAGAQLPAKVWSRE